MIEDNSLVDKFFNLFSLKKDGGRDSIPIEQVKPQTKYMRRVIVKRKDEFDNVIVNIYDNVDQISSESHMFVLYITDDFIMENRKRVFIPVNRIIDAESVWAVVK
jgi:hypothetical protein